MKLILNGQESVLAEALSLSDLLVLKGLKPERLVVERNGEIVPKNQYATVILHENDCLELLSFVGGG